MVMVASNSKSTMPMILCPGRSLEPRVRFHPALFRVPPPTPTMESPGGSHLRCARAAVDHLPVSSLIPCLAGSAPSSLARGAASLPEGKLAGYGHICRVKCPCARLAKRSQSGLRGRIRDRCPVKDQAHLVSAHVSRRPPRVVRSRLSRSSWPRAAALPTSGVARRRPRVRGATKDWRARSSACMCART